MSFHISHFMLLYFSVITLSLSTSNTTIPNLIFSINSITPLPISSYLQSFLSSSSNIAQFTITNSTDISFTNPSSLSINETLQLSLDETYSSQIHSYQTISRSSHITAKETIKTDISTNIIPPMYYRGKSSSSSSSSVDSNINCIYIHSYIINKDKYLHLNIRSVIPFENEYNIGINENDEIVLFTINDDNNNTQPSNIITLNMIDIEEKYKTMKYIELYYKPNPRLHPTNIDGMYICGIAYDTIDNIEVIRAVVIHIQEVNVVTIKKVIELDVQYTNINSITVDNEYVYIATNNKGILIYSIQSSSSNDIISINGRPSIDIDNPNVLDIMPLTYGIYVTIQGKGLYYIERFSSLFPPFQWTSQPLIPHPHLERIDYMYSDYYNIHSTLYIGIIVRNSPSNNVNEIVIELIVNGVEYETHPVVNKVYTSLYEIEPSHINVMPHLYMMNIFSIEDMNMFTIPRSVPNIVNITGYYTSTAFREATRNDQSKVAYMNVNGEMKCMLQAKYNVYIEGDVDKKINVLKCVYYEEGDFMMWLSKLSECSEDKESTGGKYELKVCEFSVVYPFKVRVNKRKMSLLAWFFIGMGVIMVVMMGTIVVLYVIRKKRRESRRERNGNENEREVRIIEGRREEERRISSNNNNIQNGMVVDERGSNEEIKEKPELINNNNNI